MNNEETQVLLEKAKSGDNKVWEELYNQYKKLIHKIAWKQLSELDFSMAKKEMMEQDLFQAGWLEFIKALKNYDKNKGSFTTYAYTYIEWGIKREKSFQLNSLGLKNNPKITGQVMGVYTESESEPVPEGERFSGRQLALQLFSVLKLFTDEEHSLTQEELFSKLRMYREVKYKNSWMEKSRNTVNDAIRDLLFEMSEISYHEKKAGEISNLYYTHTFSHKEIDEIIQLVVLTDMLSFEEKQRIIEKLVGSASLYYKTPFWDRDAQSLQFDPKAVYGRFSSENSEERRQLAGNIKVLQAAINNLYQVRFWFNGKFHDLSPYHLVVYHDNYYCIGLKNNENRIWHYRVDLISKLKISLDNEGNPMPVKVCDFPGLPIGDGSWNPEKYMAEHLYMAYDLPRDIHIKVKSDSYTILNDWFLGYYENTNEACEEGYQILRVKTSPYMIVRWALQYGEKVEIMDEDIRERIREEIEKIKNIYKK